MNLTLINNSHTKQYIIQELQKENYHDYNIKNKKNDSFFNTSIDISTLLAENPSQHLQLGFVLYPVRSHTPVFPLNKNLSISFFNNIFKNFIKEIKNNNFNKEFYFNSNYYYDKFTQLLKSKEQSENEECYHILPLIWNEQTKKINLFSLDGNVKFLNTFMVKNIINLINNTQIKNSYYSDINFLFFASNPLTTKGEFKLKKIYKNSFLEQNYINFNEKQFFNQFLSEETLTIFSFLQITKNAIYYKFDSSYINELLNYKIEDSIFYDGYYRPEKQTLIDLKSGYLHSSFVLSLDEIKQKIISVFKNEHYIGSIALISYLFDKFPSHVFLDYFDNPQWMQIKYQQINQQSVPTFNYKKFSKQLAQADIRHHYFFVRNQPLDFDNNKNQKEHFSLYPKSKITFDFITKYIDDDQSNAITYSSVNKIDTPKDIFNIPGTDFGSLYTMAWHQNIPVTNTFIEQYKAGSRLIVLYIPNTFTNQLLGIAKKTVKTNFAYTIIHFMKNIDMIIFTSELTEHNLPFCSLYYALKHNTSLPITFNLNKKIIQVDQESSNPINWFESSRFFNMNENFPCFINISLKNNTFVDTKEFFVSDLFKNELSSLQI